MEAAIEVLSGSGNSKKNFCRQKMRQSAHFGCACFACAPVCVCMAVTLLSTKITISIFYFVSDRRALRAVNKIHIVRQDIYSDVRSGQATDMFIDLIFRRLHIGRQDTYLDVRSGQATNNMFI